VLYLLIFLHFILRIFIISIRSTTSMITEIRNLFWTYFLNASLSAGRVLALNCLTIAYNWFQIYTKPINIRPVTCNTSTSFVRRKRLAVEMQRHGAVRCLMMFCRERRQEKQREGWVHQHCVPIPPAPGTIFLTIRCSVLSARVCVQSFLAAKCQYKQLQ
jgi:hypothetical protein